MAWERRIPGQDSIFLRGIQTRLNEVPGLDRPIPAMGLKTQDDVVLCPSSPPHHSPISHHQITVSFNGAQAPCMEDSGESRNPRTKGFALSGPRFSPG